MLEEYFKCELCEMYLVYKYVNISLCFGYMLGNILYITSVKIKCSNPVFVQCGSHQSYIAFNI